MRRTRWLATGMVLGAGATVWARKRVEDIHGRLEPSRMAVHLAGATRDRFTAAVGAGRDQARRREAEMRTRLEGGR